MEHPEKAPQRHSELHDPKLPVIHGGASGNLAEQHTRPSPIPQNETGDSSFY